MRPFLEERGTWEPEEGALLGQFFRPGLRFLDVGANVGYFSLLVGQHCPDAVIHAFEPHPLTSQVLALNAWASGADITTHALALSDGDRVLALTTADSNLGDTRSRASGSGTMLSPGGAPRRGAARRRLRPGQDRRPGLRDRGRRRHGRDDRPQPVGRHRRRVLARRPARARPGPGGRARVVPRARPGRPGPRRRRPVGPEARGRRPHLRPGRAPTARSTCPRPPP